MRVGCGFLFIGRLCGGNLLGAHLHAKPPLKGEVPAPRRAEGFVPHTA